MHFNKTTFWFLLFMLLLIYFCSTSQAFCQTYYGIDQNNKPTGEKFEVDLNLDYSMAYIGNDDSPKLFYRVYPRIAKIDNKLMWFKSRDGYTMWYIHSPGKYNLKCVIFMKNKYTTTMFIDSVSYFRLFYFAHTLKYHYCYLP